MSNVDLTTVWFTPLQTDLAPIALRVVSIGHKLGVSGDVRRYGGDTAPRFRMVAAGRTPDTVSVDTGMLPVAVVEELRALAGVPGRYRDPDGRAFWCVFPEVPASAFMGIRTVSLSLVFTEVTATDAV